MIINADSRQVYSALKVISARPVPEDGTCVPHLLYGHVGSEEDYSVGRWLKEARQALESHEAAIVVGGTGMYLNALFYGLAEIPPIPPEIKDAARRDLEEMGKEAFFARLAGLDPESRSLDRFNTARLLRAYEVLAATGKSISEWRKGQERRSPDEFRIISVEPERSALYAACDARFDRMMERGALEEVRALMAGGYGAGIAKTLGVAELMAHLEGRLALEEAVSLAKQKTRNYAKRQLTWFRHQLPDWAERRLSGN